MVTPEGFPLAYVVMPGDTITLNYFLKEIEHRSYFQEQQKKMRENEKWAQS
jgi:hypothetical protein